MVKVRDRAGQAGGQEQWPPVPAEPLFGTVRHAPRPAVPTATVGAGHPRGSLIAGTATCTQDVRWGWGAANAPCVKPPGAVTAVLGVPEITGSKGEKGSWGLPPPAPATGTGLQVTKHFNAQQPEHRANLSACSQEQKQDQNQRWKRKSKMEKSAIVAGSSMSV